MPDDLKSVLAELKAMDDPAVRAANRARGDDHGINLSQLRALAKRLKIQQDLALKLWATGDVAAQLLATQISKPKEFSEADLDRMLKEIKAPKVLEWFITAVVKASPHKEALRLKWKDQAGNVGRAGWSLTTERVVKAPEGLDPKGLLDQIEKEMKGADETKQWAMNHCLAEIGIHNKDLRARAIKIGEKLKVLIDYPVPRGCTSPYAPLWIAELVRRAEAG